MTHSVNRPIETSCRPPIRPTYDQQLFKVEITPGNCNLKFNNKTIRTFTLRSKYLYFGKFSNRQSSGSVWSYFRNVNLTFYLPFLVNKLDVSFLLLSLFKSNTGNMIHPIFHRVSNQLPSSSV